MRAGTLLIQPAIVRRNDVFEANHQIMRVVIIVVVVVVIVVVVVVVVVVDIAADKHVRESKF